MEQKKRVIITVLLTVAVIVSVLWASVLFTATDEEPFVMMLGEDIAVVEVSVDNSVLVMDIVVTPINVVEDSRCPRDAACDREGTVHLDTRISEGSVSTTTTLVLGDPVRVRGYTLTLLEVDPPQVVNDPTETDEYLFLIEVREDEA